MTQRLVSAPSSRAFSFGQHQTRIFWGAGRGDQGVTTSGCCSHQIHVTNPSELRFGNSTRGFGIE